MQIKDLVVLLNVSQGQIHRILVQSNSSASPTVRRYELETWAREMRNAEMHLRNMISSDTPTDTDPVMLHCGWCGYVHTHICPDKLRVLTDVREGK